jgi:methionine-rich copper-binding protein CopC/mono/diheme cytochrome c family protein
LPRREAESAPDRILAAATQRRTPRLLRANLINRIPRVIAAALLIGVAIGMAGPGPVAAHAELVSSLPVANSSLRQSPPSLTMTFSEPIDPSTTLVQLSDDQQRPVPGLGDVRVDASGLVATMSVPTLDPSVYTVSYRVTSADDGHVSAGSWAFLVDPTGTLPQPAVETQSTSPSGDATSVAARWLALAAGLMLLGLALFWIVSARPALALPATAQGRPGTDPLAAPWGTIAVVAALAFGGLAAYLTVAARPFLDASAGHVAHGGGGAFPLDFAAPFGATPFAVAMRLGEVGAGAAFLLATGRYLALDEARRRGVSAARDRDPAFLGMVAAAAALSLAGSSLAGHAASRGGLLFAGVDWLHLIAVAAWVGTLPGLLLLARRAHGLGTGGASLLGAALRRHSRLALAAAPIVALTGIANSPLVLGDARGLVATDYGNVLLAKAVLFGVAVAIGSANFFLIRGGVFRRSLPLIGLELAIGALAVLAASTLVTTQPAAGRVAVLTRSAIGTLHLYGIAGPSTVHVAVILPSPGDQLYEVSVADAASGNYRLDVQQVILAFGAPAGSGLPDQRVDMHAGVDPWLWGATGRYTPVVGDWALEVLVKRVGEPEESARFDLPVTAPLPPAVVPPPDTGIGVPLPLAWLWVALPAGTTGWLVPLALLLALAGVSAIARRGKGARRVPWSALRVTLALLAVVSGVGIGSRAAAEMANRAPASAAAAANPIAPTSDSVARGHNLYLANCAACHGISGAGDGLSAARLLPGPGDLSESVPGRSDGELAYVIASGTVATRMPAFSTTLSENDRWDLVNYLHSTWPGHGP